MASHSTQVDSIIKEIDSVQEKRSSLALKESVLFWSEYALWFRAKEKFFQKKQKSWIAFLRELKVPLGTVETKVTLYNKWNNELGYSPEDLAGIPAKKLYQAIPHADSKKTAGMILLKARELSNKEFLRWLKNHFKK